MIFIVNRYSIGDKLGFGVGYITICHAVINNITVHAALIKANILSENTILSNNLFIRKRTSYKYEHLYQIINLLSDVVIFELRELNLF